MLRGSQHILPVMYANFVTFLSFIFTSLPILYIRRVTRRKKSWATLTVLEDCTLRMWRRRTLDLAFDLVLTRKLSISLYYLIASGEGGNF